MNKRLKRVLKALTIAGVVVAIPHVVSMLTVDRRIEYKHVEFHHENIPTEMDGYKIAFISDTHDLSAEGFGEIAEKLNAMELNLLLLGGDYLTRWNPTGHSMDEFSKIVAADGIYGVPGNHDNQADLFAEMRENGIRPLANSGIHVRKGLYLAGLEDFRTRSPDTGQALSGTKDDDFVLLVSHNPGVTMEQDTSRAHLIMCGHTHGGQITFFGLWAPWLTFTSKHGNRFVSGWSESRDGVPVYVGNGAGSYSGAPRVFARPQVIIITLYGAREEVGNEILS